MVEDSVGLKDIFRIVDQIQILDIHYKAHGYFGLIGIGNVGNNPLPNHLAVSYITNLSGGDEIEVQISMI